MYFINFSKFVILLNYKKIIMDEKFDQMISIMKSIAGELGEIKEQLTALNQKLDTISINSNDVFQEVSDINLKIDKLS